MIDLKLTGKKMENLKKKVYDFKTKNKDMLNWIKNEL